MNWKEEAKKHTDYTRGLVELAAAGNMVTIDCAMYLYEQALIHGWKHAEEHLLGAGRNDIQSHIQSQDILTPEARAALEKRMREWGFIGENDRLGDECVIDCEPRVISDSESPPKLDIGAKKTDNRHLHC